MGHLGVERVLHLARQRFYWPGMQEDIKFFITKVCKCIKRNLQSIPDLPCVIYGYSTI